MMKWKNMTLAKDYGGLGVIDIRVMNEALLGKWVGGF